MPDLPTFTAWCETMRQTPRWKSWRWQFAHSVTAGDLIRWRLATGAAAEAAQTFDARIAPYYFLLGLQHDAIRRQWLPSAHELQNPEHFPTDPFDEARREERAGIPGLVQRFDDRVLIRVDDACGVICRHCTRRHPLADRTCAVLRAADLPKAVDYVRAHPAVREVILSGGDPLVRADADLAALVAAFAALPQIDAVRIGTRLPVVVPMRVTRALARMLGRTKKVWVNTQFNHPAEVTPESAEACARLVDAGIPVSSQGVLLRGINDDADTLAALFSALQRIRVRPYYMFLGDPVAGTGHFHVTPARARELEDAVLARLGGLAVPRFVADRPGAKSKLALWRLGDEYPISNTKHPTEEVKGE